MPAERLLPGTDAIPRGTVEVSRRGRKWLIRYRDSVGFARQQEAEDAAEAGRIFWTWVKDLKTSQKTAGG